HAVGLGRVGGQPETRILESVREVLEAYELGRRLVREIQLNESQPKRNADRQEQEDHERHRIGRHERISNQISLLPKRHCGWSSGCSFRARSIASCALLFASSSAA